MGPYFIKNGPIFLALRGQVALQTQKLGRTLTIEAVHFHINPLPLKYDFLRICTTFRNHELLKAYFWLFKFRMDLLHAKYTDG